MEDWEQSEHSSNHVHNLFPTHSLIATSNKKRVDGLTWVCKIKLFILWLCYSLWKLWDSGYKECNRVLVGTCKRAHFGTWTFPVLMMSSLLFFSFLLPNRLPLPFPPLSRSFSLLLCPLPLEASSTQSLHLSLRRRSGASCHGDGGGRSLRQHWDQTSHQRLCIAKKISLM